MQAETPEQVAQNWEQIKLKEKDGNRSVLAGVPAALPSLVKAFRIQEKAANVGFDWETPEQVWDKVAEETNEVHEAIKSGKSEDIESEFGDLFFSLVNAARLYNINPVNALERTNRKFIARFNWLEERTKEQGKNLKDLTLAEMDELWNQAKEALNI